jgi:antitoxin ParD1/3/4
MNVSLTPELEKMVEDKVRSGLFNSASEVVRAGLRLLAEEDAVKQMKYEALKRDIKLGLEQAKRGEVVLGKEAFQRLRKRHELRKANK